jgi:hypothetical protein
MESDFKSMLIVFQKGNGNTNIGQTRTVLSPDSSALILFLNILIM